MATKKKAAAKKAPKKAAAKKAPARKSTAAKKAPARKAAAKKASARKAAAKKAPARKAAQGTSARKAPGKRPSAKRATRSAPARRTPRETAPAPEAELVEVAVGLMETLPESAMAVAILEEPETVALEPPAPPPRPAPPAMDFPVHVGDEAPDFTLPADDGSTVSLHDLLGRKVVLYFYPRDNTPGCTIEARDFSQLLPEFAAKNAVVLGVSTDDAESHRHFKQTCELSVKLLADSDRSVHNAYGTWREKNMYGKTVWGTARTTFLIDEDGRIAQIWPKVKVEDHALDVLNTL